MLNEPIKPMLLYKSDNVPQGNQYIHQLKWDGFRCLMHWNNGEIKLFTRNQNDCTIQFPDMKSIQLSCQNAILDGEMIVLDEENKPCFESVMSRFQASNELSIRRGSKSQPAHFVAYDILYLDDKDITSLPLEERLEFLYQTVELTPEMSACECFDDGEELFKTVADMGLEGIVSKRKDSKYQLDTRSYDWLKIKNYQYEIVDIAGIRKGEFAWSLSKDGKYVGTCEFVPPNERKAFYSIAKQIVRKEDNKWVYLDPVIKCKVKFRSWTKSGMMRTPSFVEFVL
jgi:DNA ligase-1